MTINYLVYTVLILSLSFVVRCDKSSLTLVIDDTGSMGNDIDQVKLGANAIFDTVLYHNKSQIDNFLLVTFNDDGRGNTGVEVRANTRDRNVFREALSAIKVHDGGDCPEYSMAGIKQALEESLPRSQLYIFTDASAKDYMQVEDVISLAIKKQCQIVFVLTGKCGSSSRPDYKVYRQTAYATDGEVFELTKPEVGKVLEYVKESIKARKTTLGTETLPPGEHNMTFTADVIMGEVTLSLASVDPDKPSVDIIAPDGSDVWKKMLFETNQIKVYSIDVTMPGVHTVMVNSRTETRAKVAAISGIDLQHGFSKFQLSSIVDTSSRPAPGVKSHLSVKLNEGDIKLKSVHILDMDDKVIMKLPLELINDKTKFYSTKPFNPPNKTFKIMFEGYDPKTNSSIFRRPETPIAPQPLVLDPLHRKPVVTIEGELTTINAIYDQPLQLVCKASGYPEPKFIWRNRNTGAVYTGETAELELPYDYINILNIEKVLGNATFRCEATNTLGSDFQEITVTTVNPRRFNIVKLPKNTELEFGKEGKIECIVDAFPPADITWYRNGMKLSSGGNIEISSNKSTVTIKHVKRSDKGRYMCEARNVDRIEHISTRVVILGLERPVIDKSKPTHIIVGKAFSAELECKILRGTPKPTIAWFRILGEISQEQIEIKDWHNREKVVVNNANKRDSGKYLCQAANEVSNDYQEIDLVVEYPPTIEDSIKFIQTKAGTEVYIPCHVDGGPPPDVTWTKDGVQLKNNDRIHIFRDQTLKFIARPSDSGLYTCLAKNTLGSVTQTTRVDVIVPVTVKPPIDDKVPVMKGSWISLPCEANGDPKPEIQWIHYSFNTSSKSKEVIKPLSRGELQLNDVQVKQEGFYTCVASNAGGSMNITYKVLVYAPPVIKKHSKKRFEAVAGDRSLRIDCEASGNPKPSISWTKNGLNLASGSTYYVQDGTLIIKNVPKDARGYYTCSADNGVGIDEEEFTVVVRQSPPMRNLSSSTAMIERGNRAEIKCPVPHTAVDLLKWYKDGVLLENGELIFEKVSLLDAGVYTCRISNFVTSETGTVNVTVGDKPKFTFEEEDENLEMFEGLSLNCENEGVPKPEVTWYFDGRRIDSTESVYNFVMGTSSPGQYMCEIRNSLGRKSRVFNVTPRDCYVNTRKLTKHQPLMLSSSLNWPIFEQSDKYMVFTKGEQFNLFCPKKFKSFPRKQITAFCDGGMDILVNGKKYDYSTIQCTDEVHHIVQRTGEKCLESGNTERIMITYKELLGFGIQKQVYEICWDQRNNVPIYAKHMMLHAIADNEYETEWLDSDQIRMDFNELYNCEIQTNTISRRLGKSFHTTDKCCFSKRQLVNPRDVFPGPPQKATYSYFNVVPQWSTCNTDNWDDVEKKVRSFAKNSYSTLSVYTGTATELFLPSPSYRGSTNNFFTDRAGNKQPVHTYLWKVIQDPTSQQSLAIVQINVPDLHPADVSKYVLCDDVCDRIEWMRDPNWHDVNRGYIYCCSLEDFEDKFKSFKGIFESDMTSLLTSDASFLPRSYSLTA